MIIQMISMKIFGVCIFRVHCNIYNIFFLEIFDLVSNCTAVYILYFIVYVCRFGRLFTTPYCVCIVFGAFPHVQTHLRVYNIHSGGVVVFTQACILLSILITIIGRACSQMAAFEHIYSGIDCKLIWQ